MSSINKPTTLSPNHQQSSKNNISVSPIKIIKNNVSPNNWQTVPMNSLYSPKPKI
jgi:hypothetical protein